MKIENQHTEFKRLWKDDFLKSICAFASAQGGSLFIGLSDNGDVTGIDNHKKILEELPNKIRDILGLFPQINHKIENEKNYLTIVVDQSKNPVFYHGHFYYRSGSTNTETKTQLSAGKPRLFQQKLSDQICISYQLAIYTC